MAGRIASGILLTMRQAAVAYCHRVDGESAGRWLQRYLVRHAPEAVVRGGEKRYSPWYTTENLLRRYCPEFFSHTDASVKMVSAGMSEVRDMIHETNAKLNALRARVRQLESDVKSVTTGHTRSATPQG